jgi:hypothetical protein
MGGLVAASTGSVELRRTAVPQRLQAWRESRVHVAFHTEPGRTAAHHPFVVARCRVTTEVQAGCIPSVGCGASSTPSR